MTARLSRLALDVEIALHTHLARVRRVWLGTAVIEDMAAHPERVRDIDPEDQDTFDTAMLHVVADGDAATYSLLALAIRAGWAK